MGLTGLFPGLQPTNQPCTRRFPISFDRNRGYAQHFGDLVFPQAAEESQFYDASRAGIDGLECRERCVESHQILAGSDYLPTVEVRQRDPLLPASALFGHPGARVVDQDPPHGLSGNGEKVRSISVRDGPVPEETDAELVDQGVRFKRMIPTFALHEMGRYVPQLRLDDRKELVTRVRIALLPQTEPLSDLFVACHRASGVTAMIQKGA